MTGEDGRADPRAGHGGHRGDGRGLRGCRSLRRRCPVPGGGRRRRLIVAIARGLVPGVFVDAGNSKGRSEAVWGAELALEAFLSPDLRAISIVKRPCVHHQRVELSVDGQAVEDPPRSRRRIVVVGGWRIPRLGGRHLPASRAEGGEHADRHAERRQADAGYDRRILSQVV